MAKKISSEAPAPAAPTKRTPEEKAQRKADKASKRATKDLTDDRAEKKASQKQTLKSAAKQLQKELDTRMSEMVARIRKETKAKLKEVVKEATRRLDIDTEQMFEQALHTIVRHYDSIAPGRTSDINLPAPTAETSGEEGFTSTRGRKKGQTLNKDGSPRKPRAASAEAAPTPHKRAGRPAAAAVTATSATSTGRRPGRPKRQPADATASAGTPESATNDSVAVDTV